MDPSCIWGLFVGWVEGPSSNVGFRTSTQPTQIAATQRYRRWPKPNVNDTIVLVIEPKNCLS